MKYILAILLVVTSTHASEKTLIGKSLLEFSIFKIDVYEISFYKNSDGSDEIHLDYKVDVEKKHSLTGWNKSLEHITSNDPLMKEKLKWILKNTVDYAEGDKLILKRDKDKVSMIKNAIVVSSITDKKIASIIFEPWIGSKPIDEKIKKDLLGVGK